MIHLITPIKPVRCGLVATLLLVAACAPIQQQPSSTQPNWPQHQQQLAQLTHWDIMGKLGIRTPEQSNSARFNWRQQEQQFDIHITNLLGQNVATLTGNNAEVQLDIAGQGRYITDSPDQFLQQKLGWTLPVNMLNYWIKGVPAPNSPASYQLNEQGLLENLIQAGWQVNFSRYQPLESQTLPGKIRLQQDDIALTLLIKRWNLKPESAFSHQ